MPSTSLRERLGRSDFLRSTYYFVRETVRAVRDRPRDARRSVDEWYGIGPDPWEYGSTDEEQQRYSAAFAMADNALAGKRRRRALEIGCGEGLFTVGLAERCESLLAVDFSSIALARARERCAGIDQVRFAEWDARSDDLTGSFDLIVVMDVLSELLRPLTKRRALARLAGALEPGGLLLVTDVVKHPVAERSRWAGWLGHGNRWTTDRLQVAHRLELLELRSTAHHRLTLFRAPSPTMDS